MTEEESREIVEDLSEEEAKLILSIVKVLIGDRS